jgi:hypothetical protein
VEISKALLPPIYTILNAFFSLTLFSLYQHSKEEEGKKNSHLFFAEILE